MKFDNKTITFILLIFVSFNLKAQEIDSGKRDWKKYLSQKELSQFLDSATRIKKSNSKSLPFKNLQYDKVIAYDYEGNEEPFGSITKNNGNFVPVVLKQKSLTQSQVEQIINVFTDKKTYGEKTAACFNPHMAIVFYNGNTIVFKTDICLSCNYMIATEDIPAMLHNKITFDDGSFYYSVGFTKSGKRKIKSLSKELNFFYGN